MNQQKGREQNLLSNCLYRADEKIMKKQVQNILILDDDSGVRESLTDFFEDREWKVLTAATAEEAIEILGKENLEAAIVDIRLPGIDGIEFIRRTFKSYPSMAFIICTGSTEYNPPKDILSIHQVSRNIFSKPIFDLTNLEKELFCQIEKCKEETEYHE